MKNTHSTFITALLVSILFFSIPVLLKADESQEKTKSYTERLNRLLEDANSNVAECIKQLKDPNGPDSQQEIYKLYCKLAEAKFNASECIKQLACNSKCKTNSNYPKLCKLKCKAEHIKRVAEFKYEQLWT